MENSSNQMKTFALQVMHVSQTPDGAKIRMPQLNQRRDVAEATCWIELI
jgi:hypothetical protein